MSGLLILNAEGQRLISEGSYLLKVPLKFQIPISGGGGGSQPTFDAKSKNAKILNSHFWGGGGRAHGQLLMLSPEMLKSKIPISGVGG